MREGTAKTPRGAEEPTADEHKPRSRKQDIAESNLNEFLTR